MLTEVGSLWRTPEEGVTFSGNIMLPYPLLAGTRLKAVLIPQPLRRSPKEKFVLYLEMPIELPPEPPGPDDITIKGERMKEFFGPAWSSRQRNKILMCGKPGTGKSLSALGFPRCAYLDNHGSVENYAAAYPEHLYFPKKGQIATADLATKAAIALLADPGDRLTVVIDDISTYHNQVDFKWNNLFFIRQPGSKGHHGEYYSNQPNDYAHAKRERAAFIRRLLAMDLNVIVIARMKTQYAGAAGGSDFMKVIGETFAGDENMAHEFDYIFHFLQVEDEKSGLVKRYFEVMGKQRVPVGGKLFPLRSEFEITQEGRSTFIDVFKQYAVMERLEAPAKPVQDPEAGEIVQGEDRTAATGSNLAGEAVSYQQQPPSEKVAPGAATSPGPGTASEVAAAAQPNAAATNPEGPITTTQLDSLVALKQKFNIQKPEWDKELKSYDVDSARDLTQAQAEAFIKYLETGRVPF